MYLRYIFSLFSNFILFVINLPLTMFVTFPIKERLQTYTDKDKKIWLWYFVNSSETGSPYWTEEENYLNNFYGVYELLTTDDDRPDWERFYELNLIQRYFLYLSWNVFRNFAYNGRLALGYYLLGGGVPSGYLKPHNYTLIKVEGEASPVTWRNQRIFGLQYIVFQWAGKKHFRYSFTKPFFLAKIFGRTKLNFMAGTGRNRFVLKIRLVK